MSHPFRRILTPVDFDDNSLVALEAAAQMARQNDGTVLLFHVVPMMIAPADMPLYVDIYKGQDDTAKERLREIMAKRFQGIKCEILTHLGEPAGAIIKTARHSAADVIVMATHGRRGFSRAVLGSVTEMVLREAPCPVLCVRRGDSDRNAVGHWMSSNPVVALPDEKLSMLQERMREGNIRCAPVLENGHLIGIVTDRDIRGHMGRLDKVEARYAMTANPLTVEPTTPVHDAARVLIEKKIDALPVVENGRLVGVMTSSDILRAFLEEK